MISNKEGLEHLTQLFLREGICDMVISPGSRNAPMMLTFPEYKAFNIYSIIDERSAGFFALGLAQKSNKPVLLNCTSGSALLNYAPAIAEAYYQKIPLIVLSADRPKHLIDQGDGQCIRQENIFTNYIRKSVQLSEDPISNGLIEHYQQMILESIFASQYPVCGPVHINVPLAEPIYNTKEKESLSLLPQKRPLEILKPANIKDLEQLWLQAQKKMIIVGQHIPNQSFSLLLQELIKSQDVIVLYETTSNISQLNGIGCIDATLSQIKAENENKSLPDLIISLGEQVVSKKVKAWLREQKGFKHWFVNMDSKPMDTYFQLSQHVQTTDEIFLKLLLKFPTKDRPKTYQDHWIAMREKAQKQHHTFLEKVIFSDLYVFNQLHKSIPKEAINLHFANSTAIRYSQFFKFSAKHIINGNRGVSGIDGSTSTALGASQKNQMLTCLITGDISFFYDSNALWNKYLHANFRIIIINNAGGGIFRFIQGPASSAHLDLFETTHKRNAKRIALDASMEYESVDNKEDLQKALNLFFKKSKKAKILEIFTPKELNAAVLKDYFRFLKSLTAR
ncbi:MAG: 2-succinyl-5-enolpyruvyl-6-hydroxy-3-cyclohexene-1-carboxylic-acid synthase [Bacteroidetes bacterium 4572_77]|nr:MAG: 2-succinyl-5-enolpyruvyl-6-hydroxy-3-cyclohexene-1-carboxylic-acid synthase [Bacteroidetes bacterium 4572_77]